MENASKALIIAGAILLAILIIGLGMYIYQQASGVMSQTSLDSQQVTAYNSEFLQYENTQNGSNAKALYNLIASHNRTYSDDPSQQIDVEVKTTAVAKSSITALTETVEPPTTAITLGTNTLKAGTTYYVQFQYSKAGYITKATITPLQ